MPSSAYPVLILFTAIAVVCGVAAAWLVGPRRPAAIVIPTLAAFLALYWVGHRSGLELGPTMELFGFRMAIVQDVVASAVAALVAAVVQRSLLDLRHRRANTPPQPR